MSTRSLFGRRPALDVAPAFTHQAEGTTVVDPVTIPVETWPEPEPTAYGDGTDQAAAPVRANLPPRNPAPAPIIIRPRKASAWSTWRGQLEAGKPAQIAGKHLGRTSLVIRNLTAGVEVTVGPDDGVTTGVHFPIASLGQVTFDHTGAVWAVALAPAALVLLAEYDVEKGGA